MSIGSLVSTGKQGVSPTPLGEAKLREAFMLFDKDGDGSVNMREMILALRRDQG